jgi:hypothetical protein
VLGPIIAFILGQREYYAFLVRERRAEQGDGPIRVAGDDSGVHCGQRGARPHPQQVSTALQSYSGQLVDIGPRAQAAQQSTQAQCGRRRRFSGG